MTDIAGRKIIRIDLGCCYAASEVRDNPALRGKTFAANGSPDVGSMDHRPVIVDTATILSAWRRH